MGAAVVVASDSVWFLGLYSVGGVENVVADGHHRVWRAGAVESSGRWLDHIWQMYSASSPALTYAMLPGTMGTSSTGSSGVSDGTVGEHSADVVSESPRSPRSACTDELLPDAQVVPSASTFWPTLLRKRK